MTEFSTILKCDYFPLCSGCQRQGDVSFPPIWHIVKNFFQENAPTVSVPLVIGETTHWRMRAKLAVRGTSKAPEIGLFKQRSHQVVSIPTCPLHHPSINTICAKVKEALIERKIEPYNEETGRGILRYLQFVVERKSRRIQLALIVNRQAQDSLLDGFVKGIYGKGGIHSIWLNFQPDQTNRIFGDGWALCDGETYLWERLKDIECAFHPGVFGQANLNLFEKAIARIQEWVAPGKKILELYAGVGVIGLNLAAAAKQVLCVEINPLSSECFHMSCLKLAVDVKNKIHFQISSAEAAACLIADNEVIVVDPTRKGLDKGVLEALYGAQRGSQLIYLSCGPLSFQQDAEKLLSHGWKIEKAEAYLFFPGTDHVEVLCNFKKVSG